MPYNWVNEKIRASAILTTSYVASSTISDVQSYNELNVYCYYTKGSLTSLEIKIETSLDNSNWIQETNMTVSGGTMTMNAGAYTTTEDGNFKISIPLSARYARISAKGTGTCTSSLLEMWSFLHTV
jgi:major membrane immunogen (membrane-anchored lipoprotein)